MIAEEFGWVGFAADIYGPDYVDTGFDSRAEQATMYRSNNTLFYGRMQAAVDLMKNHPAVMPDKIAVIGCEFCSIYIYYTLQRAAAIVSFIYIDVVYSSSFSLFDIL